MDISGKINSYVPFHKDILMLAFSVETGWQVVSDGSGIFGKFSSGIKDVYDLKRFVHDEYIEAYQSYVFAIKEGTVGNIYSLFKDKRKVSMPVLMRTDTVDKYCNIECYYDIEGEKITRVFVMVSIMDAQESYRYKISKEFTSDRNPELIHKQAEEMIRENPGVKYAVIQFDIVKFKLVGEQYGRKNASELLEYITNQLNSICDSKQVFVRLAADVFMIVTPYECDEVIVEFINYIDSHILGYKDMAYSVVYGVCAVTDINRGLRTFGDAAAMTRQSLKGNAIKHIGFYKNEIKDSLSEDKFIEDRMEKALKKGQFKMYLQPKCEITTGKLVGAEALVRWDEPERGLLMPIKFLPLFEKNGFILKMDAYIWEQACIKIRDWLHKGLNAVPISINVSRRHLYSDDFINIFDQLIEKYDIPKNYLEIEITESIESDLSIYMNIKKVKDRGYKLLMDDFGSGYSSLNTLKDTDFDVIKIDRMFINNFTDNERGKKIVEHTIKMSKEIGIDMIAEGVETEEQALFLKSCGCDIAQGYYYDKPLPVDEFDKKYFYNDLED